MELFKLAGVVPCEFKKGSYIIRQGEEVDYLYYLISGTCYRSLITEKGDEIIYGIKESNNSIQSVMGVLTFSNGISAYSNSDERNCLGIHFSVGFGFGAVQPSLQAWAVNRSLSDRKGAANGTFLSSMDLSFTIGSIVLSFIAEKQSYAVMYRLSSIFIVLFLGIYVYSLIEAKRCQSCKTSEAV